MRSLEQRHADLDSGIAPNRKLRCHHRLCDDHQIFLLIKFHSNSHHGNLLDWITTQERQRIGRGGMRDVSDMEDKLRGEWSGEEERYGDHN